MSKVIHYLEQLGKHDGHLMQLDAYIIPESDLDLSDPYSMALRIFRNLEWETGSWCVIRLKCRQDDYEFWTVQEWQGMDFWPSHFWHLNIGTGGNRITNTRASDGRLVLPPEDSEEIAKAMFRQCDIRTIAPDDRIELVSHLFWNQGNEEFETIGVWPVSDFLGRRRTIYSEWVPSICQ